MRDTIRIGTRASALALAQARWVAAQLESAHPELHAELVPVKTTGDRFHDRPLQTIGGKGLFVKELEEALLERKIDCAVHSLKDVPAVLPEGLMLAAVPKRESTADLLLTLDGAPLHGLPYHARVGTSSPRRKALLQWLRPDLEIVPLRGNVDTRIRRLEERALDAIVVAEAGLRRLSREVPGAQLLDPLVFLPAVGQGALAIETRCDGWATVVRSLEDPVAADETRAERAFLAGIGGSCHTPLGARAYVRGEELILHGLVAHPNGRQVVRGLRKGARSEAQAIGQKLSQDLLESGGRTLLSAAPERT